MLISFLTSSLVRDRARVSISMYVASLIPFSSRSLPNTIAILSYLRLIVLSYPTLYYPKGDAMFSLRHILLPVALLQVLPAVAACAGPPAGSFICNSSQPQYPCVEPGPDTRPDVATTGYFMNHMALNVNNLTESIHFYTQLLGFQVIFQYRATAKFTIVYMGHSHGGRNGSAYQTVSELNRMKNDMEGLLELIHYDNPDVHLAPSTSVTNTFSHIGIIVSDVNATEVRLRSMGAKILKGLNASITIESSEEVIRAYGLGHLLEPQNQEEAQEILKGLMATRPENYLFVADPDGNYLEIESLYEPQLPI